MSAALQTVERGSAASIFPPDRIEEMQLEVFDSVPARHLVYAVPDWSCMPLAQPGEVLVVEDAPRHLPQEGRWFLIQWIRPPYSQWERHTVHQTVGIPHQIKEDMWGYHPPCSRGPGVTYCGDGFFSWERMTDYIRGPVVGIYRPKGALANTRPALPKPRPRVQPEMPA